MVFEIQGCWGLQRELIRREVFAVYGAGKEDFCQFFSRAGKSKNY